MQFPSFDWFDMDFDEVYEFYWDQGFALIDNILSPTLCDEVIKIYRAAADQDFAPILNLDRENQFIRENVMLNPVTRILLDILYDETMVACQTYYLFKEPGTRYASHAFRTHQDNSYPQCEPFAYMAVDIALADQERDMGCLFVYPKSHKLGLLPFEARTGYRTKEGEDPGNMCEVPKGFERVDLTLKKGQAILFDGDFIHGSYPNVSERPRPTIITNYLKERAEMIPGRTANRIRIPLG
jgi:ectoine hydroxylase-related dioxygenase (phytanoyl-CoA dioxygenase family)